MTYVLGLTGGIATGKTTVSRYFAKLGYPVVDGDKIARQIVEPGQLGLKKIEHTFGSEVIQADGQLDRQHLAKIVFSDPQKRKLLDEALDGVLRQAIQHACQQLLATHVPLIVMDIPLLYERNYAEKMDAVMLVYVPAAIQEQRLMQRDQLTKAAAQKRMNAQWPIEEKVQRADIVIDNSKDVSFTYQQVNDWLKEKHFR